jgi:hypothetical protein
LKSMGLTPLANFLEGTALFSRKLIWYGSDCVTYHARNFAIHATRNRSHERRGFSGRRGIGYDEYTLEQRDQVIAAVFPGCGSRISCL